jgi:hypothetical protein
VGATWVWLLAVSYLFLQLRLQQDKSDLVAPFFFFSGNDNNGGSKGVLFVMGWWLLFLVLSGAWSLQYVAMARQFGYGICFLFLVVARVGATVVWLLAVCCLFLQLRLWLQQHKSDLLALLFIFWLLSVVVLVTMPILTQNSTIHEGLGVTMVWCFLLPWNSTCLPNLHCVLGCEAGLVWMLVVRVGLDVGCSLVLG